MATCAQSETVSPCSGPLKGTLAMPGDKSISHRALILGAMAEGLTEIRGLSDSLDVQSTIRCLEPWGVEIVTLKPGLHHVKSRGCHALKPQATEFDCGNSGTTLRLLMGLLASRPFTSTLTGDASLQRRPMRRVANPLERMGARISLTRGDFAPLTISGGPLQGLEYELPVASSQVKGALLLAGIQAEGITRLTGRIDSRDHTERLLPHFGATLRKGPGSVEVQGGQRLHASLVQVPGDPSSAALWAAAAALLPGSKVRITGVSLNPTRTGFLEVLRRMGARVVEEITDHDPEPIGHVTVIHQELRGVDIRPSEVPDLIDELPLVAVLGSMARGPTRVTGAGELRVKESDRIDAMVENLRACGAHIHALEDGFVIDGSDRLKGGVSVASHDDHRVAMAMAICALGTEKPLRIDGASCTSISYPEFFPQLHRMTGLS
ncbi:MAG: 3-phosphoshikimate 1-carboxyvinyltransferase [Planctomycetota bacterium]